MIHAAMCVLFFFPLFSCDRTVVDCFSMQPLGVRRDAGPRVNVCVAVGDRTEAYFRIIMT